MAKRSGLERVINLARYIKAVHDIIKAALTKGLVSAGVEVVKNFWHVLVIIIFFTVIMPAIIFLNIPSLALDAITSSLSTMQLTELQAQVLSYYDGYWINFDDYILEIEEEFNNISTFVVDGNSVIRYNNINVIEGEYMDVYWLAAIHTVYIENKVPNKDEIIEFAKNMLVVTITEELTEMAGTKNTPIYYIERTQVIEYAAPYQMMINLGFTEEEIQWAELLYTNIIGFGIDEYTFESVNFANPLTINWRSAVTSEFGFRTDPVKGGLDYHTGIDIEAPEGTEIKAFMSGKIVLAVYGNSGYGYFVRIRHDNGIETLYAHCSELLVEVGQRVEQGDIIAKVGSTGKSTGNHLHFEVRVNGRVVNPRPYLEGVS